MDRRRGGLQVPANGDEHASTSDNALEISSRHPAKAKDNEVDYTTVDHYTIYDEAHLEEVAAWARNYRDAPMGASIYALLLQRERNRIRREAFSEAKKQ